MIRKLRAKMITVCMLSLLAVLTVIMVCVNLVNYRDIVDQADGILRVLADNEGHFPSGKNPMAGKRPLSPEVPYESRFFSVTLGVNGEVLSSDISAIAAVNGERAVTMAKKALKSGDRYGFLGNYRYRVTKESDGSRRVIFLDCTRNLATFRHFMTAGMIISLGGSAAVLVLLLLLSHRLIRPFSENYEKQKRFITDAGHELKTPLTVIDADAELLAMELPDNEWLRDIRRQTARLATLTNDLIYLSRMEEVGKSNHVDFPLSDLVGEVSDSFRSRAATEAKVLQTAIEPMLSYRGDNQAIAQLVNLLLDNAFKYSPSGAEIRLFLRRHGRGILLTLTNPTEGLTEEHLKYLFDRFYRADPSRGSAIGGSGIGLSVAKAIVTAHRGRITAALPQASLFEMTVFLPD